MNTERMFKLADALDRVENLFDASNGTEPRWRFLETDDADDARRPLKWFHMAAWRRSVARGQEDGEWECGAAGCVAGWACQLFSSKRSDEPDVVGDRVGNKAGELLGLTTFQAKRLFSPREMQLADSPLEARQAATALRKAAAGHPPEHWWSHVRLADGET